MRPDRDCSDDQAALPVASPISAPIPGCNELKTFLNKYDLRDYWQHRVWAGRPLAVELGHWSQFRRKLDRAEIPVAE
jgi:hypothetical protein